MPPPTPPVKAVKADVFPRFLSAVTEEGLHVLFNPQHVQYIDPITLKDGATGARVMFEAAVWLRVRATCYDLVVAIREAGGDVTPLPAP